MKLLNGLSKLRLPVIILLVIGLLTAGNIPAFTQSVTSTVTVSDPTPDIGQNIQVDIGINISGAKLGSFTSILTWNPAILNYVSNTGIQSGFTGVINTSNASTGSITFNGANATGVTGSFTIFSLTFNVAGSGTSALDLSYSAMAAADTYNNLLPLLTIVDGQVTVTEMFTLTAGNDGHGTVNLSPSGGSYPSGTTVTLTPVPNPGYVFNSWTGPDAGDIVESEGVYTIVMNNNKNVTASFSEQTTSVVTVDGSYSSTTADDVSTISFSHTTGSGLNRLMLVGVSWNSNTSAQTISSVTFTPDLGTAINLSEVITTKHGSSYRYSAIYYLLNPSGTTSGTVTITFSGNVESGIVAGAANFAGVNQTNPLGISIGAYSQNNNTTPTVQLTGLSGNELVFDNLFLGGNPPVTISVGDNQSKLWDATIANTRGASSTEQATSSSVTMSWTAASNSLWVITAVAINPAPSGTTYELTMAVNPSGAGTTTPSIGAHTYTENSLVSINAFPAAGYQFVNWTGDVVDPNSASTTVTMDADKTVTANFTQITYTLTVSNDGNGSVTLNPPGGIYPSGTTVTLTPVPSPDYVFNSWTGPDAGDIVESGGVFTISMNEDKAVTATFSEYVPNAISLDGSLSSGTGAANASSVSFSHTTGTGTNRLTLVGVSWNCGSTDRSISSVTFSYGSGPTVLTLNQVRVEKTGSQLRYSAIYSLINPPLGETGTITVTFSGAVSNGIVAGAVNFSGVNQATPLGTPFGANGNDTSPRVTLTGLNGNEIIFDNVFQGAVDVNQTLTPGSGQSQLWNAWISNTRAAASYKESSGASVTMSWTAALSSYWAICAVPINPAPSVTNYNLTILSDPAAGGLTSPSTGTYSYPENEVVNVTASPAAGYQFVNWTGDVADPNSASTTVTMDADKTVTANFTQITYTLTVSNDGNGSVTLNPPGGTYPSGTTVTLTPVPNSGYQFSSWSGANAGDIINTGGIYTIVMNGNKAVTANFTQITYTLTVSNDGNGTVTLNPPGGTYPSGTTVTLTPVPNSGYQFSSWSGANAGDIINTGGVYTIVMNGNKAVTANFTQITYTLTVSNDGNGTVTLNPPGGTYPSGTTVTLTPVPNSGYQFSSWSGANAGDIINTGGVYTIVMNNNKNVTANFSPTGTNVATSSVSVSDPTPDIGDLINVSINIDFSGVYSPDNYLGSYTGSLTWNTSVLSYNSYSGAPPAGFTGVVNPGTGVITFNGANSSGATGNIVVLNLTFNVIGAGTSTLDLSYSAMAAANTFTDLLPFLTINDGSVEVVANTYTLSIASSPVAGGTTSPASGTHTYSEGQVVNISASPAAGYQFLSWSGDVADPNSASTTVTMNSDKNVTALFTEIPAGNVTIDGTASSATGNTVSTISFAHTTGTGANRLTLVGVSWNCGTTDRSISNVTFSYGSGPTVLTLNPVITQMGQNSSGDRRYSAIYSLLNPPAGQSGTVTVTFSGSVSNGIVAGAVNFAGVSQTTPLGTPGGANLTSGTAPSVTLSGLTGNEMVFDNVFMGAADNSQTLSPGAGQTQHWNNFIGNLCGASSTKQATSSSITMSWTAGTAYVWAITAVPVRPATSATTYTLSIASSPVAGGTTSPASGTHTYSEGQVVNISASPAAGYQFLSWSGDVADPNSASTTVTMNSDKNVTANFTQITYTLTVSTDGNGSVTLNPPGGTYSSGTTVTLTPVPNSGYQFSSWSGANAGDIINIGGVYTIVMNDNKSITANFSTTGTNVVTSSVVISDDTPDVGEQITVTIFIDMTGVNPPDNKLGSYTGTLTWNTSVLTYQGYSGAPPSGFTGVVNPGTGIITFNGANSSGATGNIPVITITFNVTGEGTSILDLDYTAMAAAVTYNSLIPWLIVYDAQIETSDKTGPAVTINQASGQEDPTYTSPINFAVIFSEPVNDFTSDDVVIGGTAGATTALVTGSGTTYNVAVSGMTSSGTVFISFGAGVAHDASGNPNQIPTSSDNTVTFNFDNIPPTVTINQAAGQPDPANSSPVNFTVVFSESVSGFATGDVTLSSSTAPGTLIGVVTGSGTTYNVAVSGMTGSGTIIASVHAGVATDLAGNPNLASTSTDNTVIFEYATPSITVTSPNGGENWQVASVQNISWTSSGTSGNVRIEYSTNNGSSWTNVIASTPDDGSHSWTIPNTPSVNCLVRISDTDGSPSDVSNAVFTISAVSSGECINETFTASSGTITDNSGASNYLNNMSCDKLIQPAGGGIITLTFTQFNTEANYDFVRVYDGPTASAPLLGEFSGNSLPPTLTSSGSSMLIRFTTDYSVVAAGWSANYVTGVSVACINETFTASSGTITDNSGASNYLNNMSCDKLIQPAGGGIITLSFTEFNTEANYDFVRVYDGPTASAPLLGEFSGNSLPPTLTSSGSSMLIRFTTDYSVVAAGWTANYVTGVSVACINETFTASSGTITDNSGASNYLNNMSCDKLIQPAGGGIITLTFTQFNTEANYDFVRVYDGPTASAPLLGEFSGNSLPPTLTSSGSSMLIRFTTDYSVVAAGWSANYVTGVSVACINETFTASSGTITDNSGASNYLNNMSCDKLIQPAGGGTITLTFTEFNTEANYDFVRVYDGPTASAPLLGEFSGNSLPPTLTSSGSSMLIRFTTDYSVVAAGWTANYVTGVSVACINETFTASSGTITDNSGASNYLNNMSCDKLIQPAGGGIITLTFTQFNTEANYDFVRVYDGPTASAPLLGEFSGNSLPPTLTSSGSSMLIRFTTDYSVVAAGWTANYVTGVSVACINETFTASSGTITDNSGASNYLNNMSCDKLIQPAGGGIITLTFTQFNTEANYDFVRVYDGPTASAPLLGEFSGNSLPPTLTSSGSSMLIRFTTDYSVVAAGWTANYVTGVSVACINETFTASSGTITDNSGASNYLNNMSCDKLIQPAGGGIITLTFTQFNTEANYDFVRVYDGPTASAPLLGEFSGNSLPPTLTSSGSSMLIRFTTDYSVVAAGWSANYTSSTSGGSKGEDGEIIKVNSEINPLGEIIVYPNPTSGLLTVESPNKKEEVFTINLINSSGQIVLNKTYNVIGGKFEIDISGVSDGFYLLQIRTGGLIKFIRIIKN